jgi:hypothetical protein
MLARVAVWEPMPTDDRGWVLDAARSVPGVRDAYHLVDRQTGNGMSIALFDDEQAMTAAQAAIEERAAAIGWHQVSRPAPKAVTVYEVVRR